MTRAIRIQTDAFRPTRASKPFIVKEREAETQTIAEFQKPIPVYFVPKKSGVDASSQIEKGELFDFDLEVEPVLEVLVGRTIELALIEVKEEFQLRKIRDRQISFERIRQAEMLEEKRLEAEELRRRNERHRRIEEENGRLEVQKEVLKKVVSIKVSKSVFSTLMEDAVSHLRDRDAFRDRRLVHLEKHVVPELIQECLLSYSACQGEVDRVMREIFSTYTA